MDQKVIKTIKALRQNQMGAKYFETSEEAIGYLLSVIQENVSVGIGGSTTLKSIGIVDKLINRGNKTFFHWLANNAEEVNRIKQESLKADVYLSSTNALTMDGKLINIDGSGNRLTGMFFGPKRVYIVCGVNKIVEDMYKGIERAKNMAYLNAKRLNAGAPCVKVGKCVDCKVSQRICSIMSIIEWKPQLTDIEVIIINENLGY